MSKWKPILTLTAVAFSVLFVTFSVVSYTHSERDRRSAMAQRRIDNAKSQLKECQQIEAVKAALRDTITASLNTLPSLTYYKTHPRELEAALKSTHLSLTRFAATDCYALPVVRGVGLKPEKQ